jgi:hypothetical protein
VFSNVPDLINAVEHEMPVGEEFEPKRLRAYHVKETVKLEVDQQIADRLE